MKVCKFCGGRTEDSTKECTNCGSLQFLHICPNCSTEFAGSFCPTCGTRYDAVARICPQCKSKFYSNSCPNCDYNPGVRPSVTRDYDRRYAGANGNAMVGLVFAIIGIFTGMFPFSIIALVLCSKEKKKEDLPEHAMKLARTGYIASIVALCMNAFSVLFYLLMFVVSMAANK